MSFTKNNIVSVRLDDKTVKMIDEIYSNYLIGSTYSNRSSTNKSFIIEKAIELLYTLDFTDKYTYLNTFGSCINDNYLNCNCTINKNILIEKKSKKM